MSGTKRLLGAATGVLDYPIFGNCVRRQIAMKSLLPFTSRE